VRPHANIVRFYDAWMEPAGRPEGAEHCFIWLEKCGETVGERMRCGGDPFTEPELLELLRQVPVGPARACLRAAVLQLATMHRRHQALASSGPELHVKQLEAELLWVLHQEVEQSVVRQETMATCHPADLPRIPLGRRWRRRWRRCTGRAWCTWT